MKRLNKKAPKILASANAQTVNRLTTKVQKTIVDRTARSLKIPKKEIRRRFFKTRASPKKQYSVLRVYTGGISARYLVKGGIQSAYEKRLTAQRNSVRSGGGQSSNWGWDSGRYRHKPLVIAGKSRKAAFIARAPKHGKLMVYERTGNNRLDIRKLTIPIRRRIHRLAPLVVNQVWAHELKTEHAKQLGKKLERLNLS